MAPIGRTAARGTRAALAAAVLLPLTVAGTASAAPAAGAPQAAPHAAPHAVPVQKKLPEGLYGTADPEFDGVWRQSLAVLAQRTQQLRPAPAAIDFLTGQQCADGGFAAYRADAAKPCDAATEDTNATAAAVQALSAAGGERKAVDKGVAWLKKIQNDDGGWGFNPGGPTDANSTAVVVGALAAVGERPEKTTAGGGSPYDALAALQLGCDAKKAEQGAYAYQPEEDGALFPNDYATAAAVLAGTGNGLGVGLAKKDAAGGRDKPVEAVACTDDPSPAQASEAGAAYLAQKLAAGDAHLAAMTGEGPDHNATAVAALALAAGGHGSAAREPYGWLERDKSTLAWAKDNPAALATLILAADAVDADPGAFAGDTDLVARLNATGPQPTAEKPAADAAAAAGEESSDDDGGPGAAVWTLLGVGLAAGAGIGLLASARRKRRG
ncbi:prenyltransferase/squalene oxidase repeat-containing protein [Streptomyces sp. 184]|uniref:prenyltransferase/squalene oxidase repeat-containing protein n=1 Tax=Streptomyces sp. 184 TaxID=1827526 RepID=UPI003892986E